MTGLYVLAGLGAVLLWSLLHAPACLLAGAISAVCYRLTHSKAETTARRAALLQIPTSRLIETLVEEDRRWLESMIPGFTRPLSGVPRLVFSWLIDRFLWPFYAIASGRSSYRLLCGELLPSTDGGNTDEDVTDDEEGFLSITPTQVRRRVSLALDLQLEVVGLDADSTLALIASSDDALHTLSLSLEAAVRRHIASLAAGACR
jgi:hypothetical protein